MKTRFFILGAIFAILGFGAKAQVVEMYNQGFEETESVNYTVTPSTGYEYSTDFYVGGSRSIRLLQSRASDVYYVTDTIDLTNTTDLVYLSLEFDHMCNIETNSGDDVEIGLIAVKLARWSDADYRVLTGTEYDRDREGYSTEFRNTSTFSRESYSEWRNGALNNSKWKSERFKINDLIISSVPSEHRLLIFRFQLKKRTKSGNVPANVGWWIDNIRVRRSQHQMITPKLKMAMYPDGGAHPSSRGARIVLDARTDVPQGINNDSVYLMYSVGDDQTIVRQPMALQSVFTGKDEVQWSRFSARIPFYGYNTNVQFRCVVKDATLNNNEATFPSSAGTWVKYWCVRGVEFAPDTTPTSMIGNQQESNFPFGSFADTRCEWVIDSAYLRNAGYGPGAITDFNFIVGSNTTAQTRPNFQFRFKNAPNSYSVPSNEDAVAFTSDYMEAAYDDNLVISQLSNNSYLSVHLTDTFFYSGGDIVVQSIHNGTVNPPSVTLKMVNNVNTKKTKYYWGKSSTYGVNAYTDPEMTVSSFTDQKRPVMVLKSHKNQPLVYDAGVSALVFPNTSNPVITQPTHVEVAIKNYGAQPINGVEVVCTIDDTQTYRNTWTGTLAPGATTNFTVVSGLSLSAGFHTLRAWTMDTLTVGASLQCDYEPLNNASNLNNPLDTSFIVCAGPLNGVRNVGGPNADYATIEEFLFSLSLCGVNDSLVVRLSSDSVYRPFRLPSIDGVTQQHYVVFEPQGERAKVLFDNDGTSYMVNMVNANNVRFRNIDFVRRNGALTNMVTMGVNSDNCIFEGCTFTDSASSANSRIEAMIYSGYADNLTVRNCSFIGGGIGVDISGQAIDLRSSGATVERCYFTRQYTNALNVANMNNVTVKRNEMYDVMSNDSYVMQINACYGTVRIMANKIYTSHGAGALGAGKINGSSSNRAVIANNMIVCADDGSTNLLTTPFNLIDGSWVDAVYNSVKMSAPYRTNVAAATFGSPALTNSRFLNNIVTCYDENNYVLNYACYSQASNTIGHNVYYSESQVLNKMGTTMYPNLEQWVAAVPSDNASVSLDPSFLNGSLVDLRTFNRFVRGVGIPLTTVTTDMFDTVRGTVQTCPGAFEFVSLYYDFEIYSLASPMADVCDMPENVEMVVVLFNSGSQSFVPSSSNTLSISYTINGGAPVTCPVTQTVPSDDTISIHTGHILHLLPNGLWDSVYNFHIWITCSRDPNQTNDTSDFTVVSRYQQPDSRTYNQLVPFATAATVEIPDSVLTMWPVSDNPAAPLRRGQIKWYSAMDEASFIQQGDVLTTDVLRRDSSLYIKQRREMPIVRITQVQVRKNANVQGLTDPMPAWMKSSGTPVAVQLTNIGDAPASLLNDTLAIVSPTTSLRKQIKFSNVVLNPGEFVVVQFVSGSASGNVPTVYAPAISIGSTMDNIDIGVVYRHGGQIEDAVAFNNVKTASSTTWPTVPEYIWGGTAGVTFSASTSGGIVRTGFNGGASDWRLATNNNRMFIGSTASNWQRYLDNGCPTGFSAVNLIMQNPPTIDIELNPTELPSGCGLGMENVSVLVSNYGTQPAVNLQLNYTAGGGVISETLTTPVNAGADTLYTFLTPLNMNVPHDSVFNVLVYATPNGDDINRDNDTCSMSALSRFTAGLPDMQEPVTSAYGEPATLTHVPTTPSMPVWYAVNGEVLDTAYTYVTPSLYADDSLLLGYLAIGNERGQIGTGTTTTSGNNAYPSPYSPKNKYVKQQFIYTASELMDMGMTREGDIYSVAFNLAAIPTATTTPLVYDNYYIAMGLTSSQTFSGTSDWKTTQLVYSRQNFTITDADVNTWVEHQLDNAFHWDGESSLVVEVAFERSIAFTSGLQTGYTAKSNTALHKAADNPLTGGVLGYTGAANGRTNRRPNIQINHSVLGCPGPTKMIHINLTGVPEYDAYMTWPEGTDTIVYNSCGNIAMDVVVGNVGLNSLTNYELKYSIDGGAYVSHTVTTPITPGNTHTMQLMSIPLVAGRHHIDAVVYVAGDTITANDTIHRDFTVRLCGGTYTISYAPTANYHSIGEAVDTMNIVGIDGPVTFNIAAGNYQEQLYLHHVIGSSATNTISFVGASDSTTLINAATTSAANYVVKVEGIANVKFSNMGILSRPTGSITYANVIYASDITDRMTIENAMVRVKGSVVNANGSCIVLQGNVGGLTIQNCWIDSGYYSLKSNGSVYNYSNFIFRNNRFTNFACGGIYLQGVQNIEITKTDVLSGFSTDSRGLQGIYLKDVTGSFTIQKNHIYLVDAKKGGKQGLYLDGVKGTNQQRGYIVNNMISCHGTAAAGNVTPYGIYMKDCEYVNILFNSVRVYSGTNTSSRAFFADVSNNGSSRDLQLMNNIISNFSSYAYFATKDTLVGTSDYNNYYAPDGSKLAKWGTVDCNDLAALRAANGKDGSSLEGEPYFNNNDDLHMRISNLVGKAQYNPDVVDDIDDSVRSQIPRPTIGAHEVSPLTHNMSVVRILLPSMPTNFNFSPTNMPPNIESDSILVRAMFYNNGRTTETTASWYAYIEGYYSITMSDTISLGSMMAGDMKTDQVMVYAPLGVIDTQSIRIVLICPGDYDTSDNHQEKDFYLAPAFNLKADKIRPGRTGCTLQQTAVTITLKNEGYKPIPANRPFEIGFFAQGYTSYSASNPNNNKLNISTMPDTVRKTVSFDTPLPLTTTRDITFDTLVNFYPTDTMANIKVALYGWCRMDLDVSFANDSTTKPAQTSSGASSYVFDSYYSPLKPVGVDTIVPYGTTGKLRATQGNNRPVRWHRDSTSAPFYAPSNYNTSCTWDTTPLFFRDTAFYLQSFSNTQCPSFFDTLEVHVLPQEENDLAFVGVLAPLGGRVYMENDTVRVKIANYGSLDQQDFPITYQLRKNNNTAPLMEVTEICHQVLHSGQTMIYTFDSLLQFATPLNAGNYFLRVWTDLANDAVRNNDTIRYVNRPRPANPNTTTLDYPFRTLAESTYPPNANVLSPLSDSIDIVRVSFNDIDVELPPIGRSYTNFGVYNSTTLYNNKPECPVLHVTRGTTDTLIIDISNPSNQIERDRGRVSAYIDFNRNGSFEEQDECIVAPTVLYTDSLLRALVTIPQTASLGYMKMRIQTSVYSYPLATLTPGYSIGTRGHSMDFLVFVDDQVPSNDISINQIVSPRSSLIRDTLPRDISFRMSNKGSQPITNPHIYYTFAQDSLNVYANDFTWTGTLMPGRSAVVTLPTYRFPTGTSTLRIWHNVQGDANNNNDTLVYEYHCFNTIYLIMNDNFDSLNMWYAPRGYNNYSHNYWQLGTPNKPSSSYFYAYSEPNSWATSLDANIKTGARGNVSYLYSPIIDISQIRPDTLSFYLVRSFSNQGASAYIEYYSYRNLWEKLEKDSLMTWYNDMDNNVFNGSAQWRQYRICVDSLRSNFNEKMQFRVVYKSPQKSGNPDFGPGCAIDNFHIGRSRQRIDAGVVEIIYPEVPKLGQTIYPKVLVKNYGNDTLRQLEMGYTRPLTYLARINTISCLLPPDETDTFTFLTPFVVTKDFPDTFSITAFTNLTAQDIYRDNDTATRTYYLAPLGGDIEAVNFRYPLDNVVAGDSIEVTMRIRNFGETPITNATLSYIVGDTRVTEEVDIVELQGTPLLTREYFNYTFRQRFRASMGSMNITAIAKCDSNEYIYNDTISKRIKGITAITDVAAAAIVVDTSDYNYVSIQLVIDNRGSRGVNNFKVGFWYDDDSIHNKREEIFYRASPLTALNSTTHLFDVRLPQRPGGYRNVTAFVSVPNDNDPTNDTTNKIVRQYIDLEVLGLVVEENANPDCRVFMHMRNIGNMAISGKTIPLRAVINGNSLSYNVVRRIDPGYDVLIEFDRTIPKNPLRTYTGTGRIQGLPSDVNPDNNQTNKITVVNYVEGIPTVNGDSFVLGQNYPNPFSGTTTVPFNLPNAADVTIFVMDAMGKMVYTSRGFFQAGDNIITLNLDNYSTGVYYYGIIVDGVRQMRKLIVK